MDEQGRKDIETKIAKYRQFARQAPDYETAATDDSEVERIYGRAFIESIGPETSVRHRPPVFVKPSKLPSIRPRPSCDANIDIPKRRPESTRASLG
jgi:hypothetical protein